MENFPFVEKDVKGISIKAEICFCQGYIRVPTHIRVPGYSSHVHMRMKRSLRRFNREFNDWLWCDDEESKGGDFYDIFHLRPLFGMQNLWDEEYESIHGHPYKPEVWLLP